MHASLSARLQAIENLHREYIRQVEHLSHEQLNRQPAPGQWSAGQVLHHLLNVIENTRSFMETRMAENKVNTAAGIKNALKSILLQVALASPLKFKAPRAAGIIPDTVQLSDLQHGFTESFGKFNRLLDGLPAEYADKEIFKHPRVGYITPEQTLDFIKAHARHHGPQLENVLKSL